MYAEFKTVMGKRCGLRLARCLQMLSVAMCSMTAFAQGHPFSLEHPAVVNESLVTSSLSAAPVELTPLWLQNPWTGATRLVRVPEPNQSLWNAARIEEYEQAITAQAAPPLALFTISRLGIKVPVYNGTDEFNLDRGLGRIPGMARIHEDGHLGISGHRDGFFRVLKDIQPGDRIMLRSASRSEVFEVQEFSIVDKHDDRILHEKSDQRRLTLVTCYPFYFVGSAPQRFIVHAVPVPPVETQAVTVRNASPDRLSDTTQPFTPEGAQVLHAGEPETSP